MVLQAVDAHTGAALGELHDAAGAAQALGVLLLDSSVVQRQGRELVVHRLRSGAAEGLSQVGAVLPRGLASAPWRLSADGKELLAQGATGEVRSLALGEIKSAVGSAGKAELRRLRSAWRARGKELWAQAGAALRSRAQGLLLAVPALPGLPSAPVLPPLPVVPALGAGQWLAPAAKRASTGTALPTSSKLEKVHASVVELRSEAVGAQSADQEKIVQERDALEKIAQENIAGLRSASTPPASGASRPVRVDSAGRVAPAAQWLSRDQLQAKAEPVIGSILSLLSMKQD